MRKFVARGLLSATLGVLTVPIVGAAAAMATVTITPDEALQGGAAEVTFGVPDDRGKAYTAKVEVEFPSATPIAEVYPMSVAGWAPRMTTRDLPQPIEGIHGSGATTITTAITWLRNPGAVTTGKVNDLKVSMGPMPQIDRLGFTVTQTYSDGQVKTWAQPAEGVEAGADAGPVLTLRAGNGAPTHGHAGDPTIAAAPTSAPVQSGGGSLGYLLAVVAGGLLAAIGAGITILVRRSAAK